MIIEHFDVESHKEEIMSKNKFMTEGELDNMITRRILSKILRIDIDNKFYEIHLDLESWGMFQEMSHFAPLTLKQSKNYNNGAVGSMMGKTIFLHHNEYRYISLFNDLDEVARVYLIDRSVLREERLKKLLDK